MKPNPMPPSVSMYCAFLSAPAASPMRLANFSPNSSTGEASGTRPSSPTHFCNVRRIWNERRPTACEVSGSRAKRNGRASRYEFTIDLMQPRDVPAPACRDGVHGTKVPGTFTRRESLQRERDFEKSHVAQKGVA